EAEAAAGIAGVTRAEPDVARVGEERERPVRREELTQQDRAEFEAELELHVAALHEGAARGVERAGADLAEPPPAHRVRTADVEAPVERHHRRIARRVRDADD